MAKALVEGLHYMPHAYAAILKVWMQGLCGSKLAAGMGGRVFSIGP